MRTMATMTTMTIWTTWLPDPPKMPATMSVPSPIAAHSCAWYPSNRTRGWNPTATARGSQSGRAGDEPLAVEEAGNDAKENDVGDEQHQREHHCEGDARREDIEGHESHDCERWNARQRS